MYAVIKTGGKQYRVAAGEKIQIERLTGNAGDQVEFGDVLMVANGGAVDIGAPFVAGATVVGEIASQDRGPHITIFKKRRRKHYRRKNGHRQDLTSVTIHDILTGGAKPAAKKKAAASAAHQDTEAEKAAALGEPKVATLAQMQSELELAEGVSVDDISLIGGIGPKFQKGLAGLGVTTLAQIAAWTEADVERIEEALNAKGRAAREEWIEQARELMAGKPPRAKADKARAKDQE